jgi:hypothetical protein
MKGHNRVLAVFFEILLHPCKIRSPWLILHFLQPWESLTSTYENRSDTSICLMRRIKRGAKCT